MSQFCALLLCVFWGVLSADLTVWEGSHPEGFSAEMTLSALEIHTDESLILGLRLRYPESYRLDWRDVRSQFPHGRSDMAAARFFLVGEEQRRRDLVEGYWVQDLRLILEPWVAGYYSTGLRQLRFEGEEGETVVLRPQVTEVEVKLQEAVGSGRGSIANILPVTDQGLLELDPVFKSDVLYDEEKQEREARRNQDLFEERSLPWKLLLIVTVLGGVSWILWRLWPRLWRVLGHREEVDPQRRALEALRVLMSEGLPDKGLYEPFYVRLTQIVRVFVEDRYGLQAPEQTTEEFLLSIREHPHLLRDHGELLQHFLRYADLIKFARMDSTKGDCHEAWRSAETFVQAAIPEQVETYV